MPDNDNDSGALPPPTATATATDSRSGRPLKKSRTPTSHTSSQSSAIQTLFSKNPSIHIPASSGPRTAASLPPPPEIVQNVQGSSAGAGSGEFHVYKASRRREYERLRLLEEEMKRKQEGDEWARKRKEVEERDREKLGRNQKRRAKKREKRLGQKDEAQSAPAVGAVAMDVDARAVEAGAAEATGEGNGIVIHDDA